MPGRTRPIEKFAQAAAKCSPEVWSPCTQVANVTLIEATGCRVWKVHLSQLSEREQRHVCTGVHAPQELLFGIDGDDEAVKAAAKKA
ncbi:hypothetical protein LTR15_000923 [Elasticomyces elasticus]|nr:hypothetical protein LTR15_000923 [Elasticomyces elasticus]